VAHQGTSNAKEHQGTSTAKEHRKPVAHQVPSTAEVNLPCEVNHPHQVSPMPTENPATSTSNLNHDASYSLIDPLPSQNSMEEEEYLDMITCPEYGMVTLGDKASNQVESVTKEMVDLKLFKTPQIDKLHVMLSELCIWIGDTGGSCHMSSVWMGYSEAWKEKNRAHFAIEGAEAQTEFAGSWIGRQYYQDKVIKTWT
jgi:hypothetical protein